MNVEISTMFELVSVMLALIGGILGTFKYFSAEIARLRAEADLKDQAIVESQSKARHALANASQIAMSKIESEQAKLGDRITSLALDTVRKSEMTAIETRYMAALQGIETRLGAALDKSEANRAVQLGHLEAKVDKLAQRNS